MSFPEAAETIVFACIKDLRSKKCLQGVFLGAKSFGIMGRDGAAVFSSKRGPSQYRARFSLRGRITQIAFSCLLDLDGDSAPHSLVFHSLQLCSVREMTGSDFGSHENVHSADGASGRQEGRQKEKRIKVMTRRKKPEGEAKTHQVTVRLDDTEYEMICDAAEDAGVSISEYLRQQGVFGKIERSYYITADIPKLDEIARQLSAIGNNLNQLTLYFHMGGLKSQAMTDELTRCINEVMKMRKELMEIGGEFRGNLKTHRK